MDKAKVSLVLSPSHSLLEPSQAVKHSQSPNQLYNDHRSTPHSSLSTLYTTIRVAGLVQRIKNTTTEAMDGKDSGKNGSEEEQSGTWRVGLKENDIWRVDLKESDTIRRVTPKESDMWGVGKSGRSKAGDLAVEAEEESSLWDVAKGAAAVVGAVAAVGWGLYTIFGEPPSPSEKKKEEKMMNAPGRPGVRIPRKPFEGNAKDYFTKLHKENKKR